MPKQEKVKKVCQFYDTPPNSIIRDLFEKRPEYTKENLKTELGVSMEAIRQWTTGYARPNFSKLKGISKFFGVTVNYLLGETTSESTDPDEIAINRLTGLSSEAIKVLRYANGTLPKEAVGLDDAAFSRGRSLDKASIECINKILEEKTSEDKHSVLDRLKQYLLYDRKNHDIVSSWEDEYFPSVDPNDPEDYFALKMVQLQVALRKLWDSLPEGEKHFLAKMNKAE